MEEDRKKRKNNKKKKNKQHHQQQQQAKAAANAVDDTASSNAGETSSQDHNHVEERDRSIPSYRNVNGGVDNGSDTSIEVKAVRNNGYSGNHDNSVSAVPEKQKWLHEEAKLREMLKQLLYEKDSCIQLQAELEIKLEQLQFENDSWREKEVSLKQRISQLMQEKAGVILEEERLREKVRQIEKEKFSLVENESSGKELIANLSNENTRLRMQVLEVEGTRNSLSQENRQLLDCISTLESRILDLERTLPSANSPEDGQKDATEKEDLNAQIDAACSLVEKLVTENADLVEKLNELYMELNRQSAVPDVTSIAVPDYALVPDPVSGSGEDISSSSRSAKHFETVPIRDERGVSDDLESNYANVARHSSDTTVSGEIVQIPLDEHEAQDLEAQTSPSENNDGVPLTDAPLIGAPFRLIGYFAKYVSGADLVNKSSSDSQVLT